MEKFKKSLLWFFHSYIWLFILFLIVDIVTKLVVSSNVGYLEKVPLIPGFLNITYVKNFNAAFGIGSDNPILNRWMYVVVALIGASAMIFYYVKSFKKTNDYVKACLNLMLVGAIGNLIDRSFYSFSNFAVVDWIDFAGIWGWVFNIADSCIVVGTIMLICYLVYQEILDYKAAKAKEVKVEGKVLSKTEQDKLDSLKEEDK